MSAIVNKTIDLDFSLDTQAEVILSQYDKNSRELVMKLFNNKVPWNELDTSGESTMSAKVQIWKPDNKPESEVATITNANEVTLTIPKEFTTAIGKVIARLTIRDSSNEAVISLLPFTMFIIS